MKTWLAVSILLFSGLAMAQTEEKLSPAEKRALDTFFSNFSEANVESFSRNGISDDALLQFALAHNYINRLKSLTRTPDGQSVLVPAKAVDETTLKYFGRKIARHAQPSYQVPMAEGEAYAFSQIVRLLKQDNGLFKAEGTIYVTSSGGTPDPHGTPAQWKKQGEEVTRSETFSALIEHTAGRYILLEYRVAEAGVQAEGGNPVAAIARPVESVSIPIEIRGKTFQLHAGMKRSEVLSALSTVLDDAPSVDTAERLQYDTVLVPDNAPVTVAFDFDKNGVVSGVLIDAFEKAQNPPVVALIEWLQKTAGTPKSSGEGISTWRFGGWKIEHREGGSGEDSTYSVEVVPAG